MLAACVHSPVQVADRPRERVPVVLPSVGDAAHSVSAAVSGFDPKQIGKGDIDRVADLHRREVFAGVRVLAEKLYRRNPREWKKAGHASMEEALDHLLDPRNAWRVPGAESRRGTEVILLALREDYPGDRVAAFIAGLGDMLNLAFDEKLEFFLLDDLDPQKLYNSARNIEIAVWKLSNARDAEGRLLLLSNEIPVPPEAANLSFEREFGKMIGNLDLLARMIADKGNRAIARVVQNVATAMFLPVTGLR